MKLLTHNLLMCNKKGCTINNFPLKIICTQANEDKREYDDELMKRFLKKVDLVGLSEACKDMNLFKYEFQSLTEDQLMSKEILEYMHHCLFEVTIDEGMLLCNNCGREYPIKNGIANMILNDDEV